MSKEFKLREKIMRARAARSGALARAELRVPTEPRAPAASPTAMAVKTMDAPTRAMIDAELERRRMR